MVVGGLGLDWSGEVDRPLFNGNYESLEGLATNELMFESCVPNVRT
jgi:hypothetical protein